MPSPNSSRLAYIDWMRGLACVVMFQTHCYDSWLGGNAAQELFLHLVAAGGNLASAAVSFSCGNVGGAGIDKTSAERNSSDGNPRHRAIRRGAEILGLGLLFRCRSM